MSNTIIEIPGIATAIAEIGRPAIPEGTFLAVVQDVETKLNAEKGSFGLNWSLLVNLAGVEAGWDIEARAVPIKHYTYIGKMQNGKLIDTSNAFKTAEIMNALGFTNGVLDTAAAKHRQVIVIIKHEPDDDGNVWPRVRKVKKYELNGQIAPVLQHLAEAEPSEAQDTNTPAGDIEF